MLRRLASAKLAAVLLAALLVLCVVAFVIPQRSHSQVTLYDEWRQANPALAKIAAVTTLDEVFSSPLFFGVLALLAVNLSACTLRRALRRRQRVLRMPSAVPPSAIQVLTDSSAEEVVASLRRGFPGWRADVATDRARTHLHLDRGFWGFWGSVVLHVGILLVLLGGVVSGLTRFDGQILLTEGQAVADEPGSYIRPPREPRVGEAYHDFAVRLDSLRFEYEQGEVTQAYAQLAFSDPRRSSVQAASINNPALWQRKAFLLIKGGHAVALRVAGPSGEELLPGSIVRLGKPKPGGYSDEIELSDGSRLSASTLADASDPVLAREEPLVLRDPQVVLTVPGSSGSLSLRPGQSGKLGGMTVTVSEVRMWNEFAVREDRGIPITYSAFGLILLGMLARLVFGSARLSCLAEPAENGLRLSLWSDDARFVEKANALLSAHPVEEPT